MKSLLAAEGIVPHLVDMVWGAWGNPFLGSTVLRRAATPRRTGASIRTGLTSWLERHSRLWLVSS